MLTGEETDADMQDLLRLTDAQMKALGEAAEQVRKAQFAEALKVQMDLVKKAGPEGFTGTSFRLGASGIEGHKEMAVHPLFYRLCQQFYGPECWDDPAFVRDCRKHLPMFFVKYTPRAPSIIVPDTGVLT